MAGIADFRLIRRGGLIDSKWWDTFLNALFECHGPNCQSLRNRDGGSVAEPPVGFSS
jgi:hypothetical protein